MSQQIDNVVSEIDRSMRQLRQAMRGIQIRTAGFKKDHDELARGVAEFTVVLIAAEALVNKEQRRTRRRR